MNDDTSTTNDYIKTLEKENEYLREQREKELLELEEAKKKIVDLESQLEIIRAFKKINDRIGNDDMYTQRDSVGGGWKITTTDNTEWGPVVDENPFNIGWDTKNSSSNEYRRMYEESMKAYTNAIKK